MNITEHLALLMKQYEDAHKEGRITTGQFEALMDGALQAVADLELVEGPDQLFMLGDGVFLLYGYGERHRF